MRTAFSKSWNRSIQPRKQRKYVYNAPLHIRQGFMRSHLSKELRLKYDTRTVNLRSGDKVTVMRGSNRGKSGKVEKIDLKKSEVLVTGIESVKKDGSKAFITLNPSNLMITELNLSDNKRKAKLESGKMKTEKTVPKKTVTKKPVEKKVVEKQENGKKSP